VVSDRLIEADVEEIPFDDNEEAAMPCRDIQPPRVNTFFDDETQAT